MVGFPATQRLWVGLHLDLGPAVERATGIAFGHAGSDDRLELHIGMGVRAAIAWVRARW